MNTHIVKKNSMLTTVSRLFSLLTITLLSTVALAAEIPEKSPNDTNQYRFIELENALKVILVSDQEADKAAASMNVAVGSGDDPADREGLSHFLEHMLFLGTQKYPDPGEYQQFIKSHGGQHNAFTAFQDTNYFFDVQPEFLEPALDRFAQQFSAPLFTAELVDRERNAVHSEFSAKQKEDGRRFYSVRKAVSNPDHAFSQFAVGNLSTLENTEENPLRPDLIEFWKQHYSSNIMSLAVYGPQSLDELEAMVRNRFDAIENRKLETRRHAASLYRPDDLPARVTAEALRDVRSLSLAFPIPSQKANYRTKPAGYVANLLGHEGPGSLFDVLKRAGLAESLSAGLGMDTGENATFEISISLTPEGLARHHDILPLVFDYVEQVRRDGVNEQRFLEMQNLARLDFRFREQGSSLHEVMRLSRYLQDYPPEDVLRAPWLVERFAPEQYRDILDQLTPENLLAFVLAPEPGLENPNRTDWYEAAWSRETLDPESLRTGNLPKLAAQLRLPPENPFVPDNLEMVPGHTMDQPSRLASLNGLDLWFARDTRFDTPKANVFVGLRTPAAQASARNHVLTRLLVDTINANLNAWAYSAGLAGLDYSVYPHLRGITVRVGGYNDKLHTLMNRILLQVASPELTEQRFDIARQQLIDSLQNKAKDRPVQQTSEFVQTALIEDTWPTNDKLEAARNVRFDDLQSFAQTLLSRVDPVMLAHGNLTEASALNLARQTGAIVLRDSEQTTVERSQVRKLPERETGVALNVDHPDTGYTLYLQGDNTSFAERARFRLLGQIISSPFYEEIRTNRQLGYIVYATAFEMLEAPALGLVVQSPSATGAEIDQAVQAFASDFEATLAALTPERLQREKQAVISKLLQRDRQLGEISSRYWRETDRGMDSFDSRQQLANAIEQVSHQELLEMFQQAVVERSQSLRVITGGNGLEAREALERLTQRPPVPAS